MDKSKQATPEQIAGIKQRILPVLKNVSTRAIKAWLKTRNLATTGSTEDQLASRVAKHIAEGAFAETVLEEALIGFEESSGKRIYLFTFEKNGSNPAPWSSQRLSALSIPPPTKRKLAGDHPKPMTAIYSETDGNVLRVKWSEEHTDVKLGAEDKPVYTSVEKRIVLVANLKRLTAELRMDPPEARHSYADAYGKMTEQAYYSAYRDRAAEVLDTALQKAELGRVIKALVAEEKPRVVRIHVDNHTGQTNFKWNVRGSRIDIRDDPEWQAHYKQFGHTWAWDSQSFHWLPEPSSDHLKRELFSHLDATEGYLKVNADCSDEEVEYAISQVRAR
jgi:hypothetical protein